MDLKLNYYKTKFLLQRIVLLAIGFIFFSGCFTKKNTTELTGSTKYDSLLFVVDSTKKQNDSINNTIIKEKLINDTPANAYGCPPNFEKIEIIKTTPENE
ncbi:MAG: hypothetical protein JXR58_03255 [Bacteroidales bacterium]|nr:hypothetical protein [Bacteroidales bacterium]